MCSYSMQETFAIAGQLKCTCVSKGSIFHIIIIIEIATAAVVPHGDYKNPSRVSGEGGKNPSLGITVCHHLAAQNLLPDALSTKRNVWAQ